MAKANSKGSKGKASLEALTQEEGTMLSMYRECSRWEKNAFFLLMQSVAWGPLVPDLTDRMSWAEISRTMGLRSPKKGGRNG